MSVLIRVLANCRARVGVGMVLVCASAFAAPPEPIVPKTSVRVERITVPGGGELYTYFRPVPDHPEIGATTDVPFLSIFRDTLGDADPTNDQLRQIWAFTYSRPSIWRRLAASVPFLYHRAGWASTSGKRLPPPLFDMAFPARGTAQKVGASLLQSTVLDPFGMLLRTSSRSYRRGAGDYRMMHVWEATDVLAAQTAAQSSNLAPDEMDLVQGRLLLSGSMFGGLVDDHHAAVTWRKNRARYTEFRGHNWELLRQRAEDNGLYFQPISLSGSDAAFALLWVEQPDAARSVPQRFDSQFLSISDPFRDDRVRNWKGYRETWFLDSTGARSVAGDPQARAATMVPLALYSLDHPRVPLLLADFRNPGKPKRREMISRISDDVTTGVLGWTGMGHWPYLMANSSWAFIHGRRGVPTDREARLRAYVQLRHALQVDETLEARLRRELIKRLDQMGLNPFEDSVQQEATIARKQYAALISAANSGALGKDLARERNEEAERYAHSTMARFGFRVATFASASLYRHHEPDTPETLAEVDRLRRFAWHKRFLEQVLEDGPQPNVVADMGAVRRSVQEITEIGGQCRYCRGSAAALVTRVMARSTDETVRAECQTCLERLNGTGTASRSSAAPVSEPKSSSGDAQ